MQSLDSSDLPFKIRTLLVWLCDVEDKLVRE